MSRFERITVTLPGDLIRDIDRREGNRSKFVAEAVRNEVDRRRREELQKSLRNPHPDTIELSTLGFDEWARRLPEEDVEGLIDHAAGKAVEWIPGKGWVEPKS